MNVEAMRTCLYTSVMAMLAVLETVNCQPDESCPYKGCDCGEETIDCQFQSWKTIPQLLIPNIDGLPFLDMEGNSVTTIPAGSLPSGLSGIDLQVNPLLSIDDSAFDGSVNTMKKILISRTQFTRIPDAIGHLNVLDTFLVAYTTILDWKLNVMKQIGKTVTTLSLDHVLLSVWPNWIENFLHLQTLDIQNCNITTIPDNAFDTQVHELTTLTLEEGFLTEVPVGLSKLSALSQLSLDNNNITQISNLPSFGNLTILNINNNSLSDPKHVSDSLKSVSNCLTILSLNGNKLEAFPDLSFMTKLQSAYFSDNDIYNTISGSIPSSLTFLEIEGNNMESLPTFISGEGNLDTLRMARNAIADIVDIQLPINVRDLDLSKNVIIELSNQSFPLNSKLEFLSFDYNPLSKIDVVAFSMLKHMQYLSLRGTKLMRLPLSLISLSPLNSLDLTQIPTLICTCLEKPLRAWVLELDLKSFGDCGTVSVDNFLRILSADCPD